MKEQKREKPRRQTIRERLIEDRLKNLERERVKAALHEYEQERKKHH